MAQLTGSRLFIRDSLSLGTHEYVLWIGDHHLLFLRGSRGRAASVLAAAPASHDSTRDFEQLLAATRQSPYYWGQPVRVIVSSADAFTYARQVMSGTSSSLQRAIPAVSRDDHLIAQGTISVGDCRFIVVRSIDKHLLATVDRLATAGGIPVLGVMAAGTCLVCHDDGHNRKQLQFVDDSTWEYWHRSSGHIINTNICALQNACAVDDSEAPICRISKDESFRYLVPTFKTAGCFSKVSFDISTGRRARSYTIMTNALRLLSAILAAVFLAALVGTISLHSLIAEDASRLDVYQQSYSNYLALKQRIESLRNDIAQVKRSESASPPLAGAISLFCQRSYPGLYLTTLNASTTPDALTITAEGNSLTEEAVFDYAAALRTTTSWRVITSQIQPVADRRGSKTETEGVTFRIDVTSADEK